MGGKMKIKLGKVKLLGIGLAFLLGGCFYFLSTFMIAGSIVPMAMKKESFSILIGLIGGSIALLLHCVHISQMAKKTLKHGWVLMLKT